MVRQAALAAHKAGLCILPTATDGSKAPAIKPWGQYKTARPSVAELRAWRFDHADGFGVVAGAVSGHVECWDIDEARTGLAFDDAAVASGLGAVWTRITTGYLDQTPGGGFRILVRYPPDVVFSDCTLARRPGRAGEPAIKTLIEFATFSIVAPSNGRTHPSGGSYTRLSGGFDTIASYSADERQALITLARSFDQLPRPEHRSTASTTAEGNRPGDRYNQRMTWPALLEPHGWTLVFEHGDVAHWRRPGKTWGVSATTNFGGADLLYVFTSSTVFDADVSYSKFAAYAVLEHGGDFRRAALALSRLGYEAPGADASAPASSPDQPSPASSTTRVIHVAAANTIAIEPVSWLLTDWLPLGAFVLLGGREGIGKSMLAYTLAADVTCGRLPGVYAGVPRSVLVAATEDSWSHTIVPRLMAAKADLARVYRIDVLAPDGTELALTLPLDTTGLAGVARETEAGLIVFDPLLSRIDAKIDTHKDSDTRRALEPLAALARTANVTCLGLIHVSKSSSHDALTLLMASRAFTAVARSVLFILVDPDDDTRRVLGLAKNNLGRTDLPLRSFRIKGVLVTTTAAGDEVWTGQLEWLGESERSLRDLVEQAAAERSDRGAVQDATEWLTDYLTEQGGCVARTVIVEAAKRAGHSQATIDRARHTAHIRSEGRGFPRVAYWLLPPTSTTRSDPPP
jgi:hypothetical protein